MGFLDGRQIKVELDCFPCFLKQTVIALRLAGAGEETQRAVIGEALRDIGEGDWSKTPAHLTTTMHRSIRRALGKDPFIGIKAEYNKKALELYPELKRQARESKDPLLTASRLAIAGNVIDFGIFTSVDIGGAVLRALSGPLEIDDYGLFNEEVRSAEKILYLLDNAGEIVFDRLLIETLCGLGKEVTAVVKGGPIINDCTAEDARQSGLDGVCAVIDNGSDAVGTILETASSRFMDAFDRSRLVIAKGQGNFETLLGLNSKRIFFLFQSKCKVVSRVLALTEGAMLLVGN